MELTTYLQNLVMLIGLGSRSTTASRRLPVRKSLARRPAAAAVTPLAARRLSGCAEHYPLRRRTDVPARGWRDGDKEDAIVRTMETAGRAVVFSGTAVGIGLALMLFMPLPFMRGFGIGGLVIPLVSVVCALTLLPVLLYWLAAPLDRVHLIPRRVVERRDSERNGWYRLAHAIMRRPAVFAAGTTALLLALALPVLALELGPGSNDGVPQGLERARAELVTEAAGEGALAPTVIVVDTGRPRGYWVRRWLRRCPGSRPAFAPTRRSRRSASTSRRNTSTRRVGTSTSG